MKNKFKDLVRTHINVELSSSCQATNVFITGMNIDPERIRAVEVIKNGIPCNVTWYCDFSDQGISTITAITITGSYNIGYGGEGPSTLFMHMEKLGFINDITREALENLVFRNTERFYFEK